MLEVKLRSRVKAGSDSRRQVKEDLADRILHSSVKSRTNSRRQGKENLPDRTLHSRV